MKKKAEIKASLEKHQAERQELRQEVAKQGALSNVNPAMQMRLTYVNTVIKTLNWVLENDTTK